MTIAFVRWRDAMTEEAETGGPAQAQLIELSEIGWLVAESPEAITLSMELESNETPGRFRLHIPRSGIIEFQTIDSSQAFKPKRKARK